MIWMTFITMESHEFVIDRIEGEIVVVEWENSMISNIPTSLFHNQALPREGEVYTLKLKSKKSALKVFSDDLMILSKGSIFIATTYHITSPSHIQLYPTLYPEDLIYGCSHFDFPKHGHASITKSFPVGPFKAYTLEE